MSFLSPLIAIDLGTNLTRIYLADADQQSELPTGERSRKRRLFSRSSQALPLVERGRVTDERAVGTFLHDALAGVGNHPFAIAKPRVLASVYGCFSRVEKMALARSLFLSGASQVQLVSEAVAAGFGSGLDLDSNHASVLLSCGDGVSELAVVLSGKQILAEEMSLTKEDLAQYLSAAIAKELGIRVSPDGLIKYLESHSPLGSGRKEVSLPGKNLGTGKLEECLVPSGFLTQATTEYLEMEALKIERLMRHLPGVLATDVVEQGMMLYGSLAGMKGLPLFLSGKLSLPVSTVPDPETAVIKGMKEMIASISFPENDDDLEQLEVLGC